MQKLSDENMLVVLRREGFEVFAHPRKINEVSVANYGDAAFDPPVKIIAVDLAGYLGRLIEGAAYTFPHQAPEDAALSLFCVHLAEVFADDLVSGARVMIDASSIHVE